ncbi:MAG: hypothetical protein IH869_07210 [Chloroflexi bacterium]|nr:hypothetical protein [Chloroflexota bacterium]
MKRFVLPILVTLVAVLVAACGADATATPTEAPPATAVAEATATPEPTPTPTIAPPAIAGACTPEEGGTVYEISEFVVQDGSFDLVMGAEPYWGYEAGARVSSTAGGIIIKVSPNDVIRIGTVRSSSTVNLHAFTVAALGVDITLVPGGSQDGIEIAICELGSYAIDDNTDRGRHGLAEIVSKERKEPAGGPVIYVLDNWVVEDGNFELRMGAEDYWGYEAEARPVSKTGDGIIMTVNVGDTIQFARIRQSGSRSTKPHHFTIVGLGIDINLDEVYGTGGGPAEPYEFVVTTEGTFVIDDSTDPGEHGKAVLIVGPALASGTVFEVDAFVVEDGLFEMRMLEGYWGYQLEGRPTTRAGELLITAKVGDTIKIGTIRQSGSRSTKAHHFTIEGLGIDINLDETYGTGGGRVEFYEIKLDVAGTFTIDDSTDPGEHGKASIVVTE